MLVLLPVPGSTFQARFSGPHNIEKKISDLDYVISTPDKRQPSRVCHINMLKPYYARESENKLPETGKSDLPTSEESAVLLSSVVEGDDYVVPPLRCVTEGRLNNSVMLIVLKTCLPHLNSSEKDDILSVVNDFP